MNDLLLYPEVFRDGHPKLAKLGRIVGHNALQVAAGPMPNEPVSVAIRSWNEADQLDIALDSFKQQRYGGELQLLVIDNESTDHTRSVVRNHRAELVTLPYDEFTYPRSLNRCMEAADAPWVFLTVGHAACASALTLAAAMRHTGTPGLAGAYSGELMGLKASSTDRMFSLLRTRDFKCPPQQINKAAMGVMAATSALVAKSAWQEMSFDERYGMGGEDTAWAAAQLAHGNVIIRDPAMSTHHSHGLGPLDFALQVRQWRKTLRGPQPFDRDSILARRPDHRHRRVQPEG